MGPSQGKSVVQVICIQGGIEMFHDGELGLCYYEADVDDYIPVASSLQPDPATGNLVITAVSNLPERLKPELP